MNYGKSTVYIPKHMNPRPHDFEISAAEILSQFFQAKVNFLARGTLKTSDLEINGRCWEIKTPIGNSKRTIQNNLRKADNQSENVVLDLRRCKIPLSRATGYTKMELSRATRIKRLLIITKSHKVIVIL